MTGFINDYSQMRDSALGALSLNTGFPRQLMLPFTISNQGSALTYGFEASVDWIPKDNWRLQSSYSFLHIDFSSKNFLTKSDPSGGGAEKVTPQHQLSVRSNHDLSKRLQFNLWLRYISNFGFYHISGYVTMDAKLAYKPAKNTELFVVGQNLNGLPGNFLL